MRLRGKRWLHVRPDVWRRISARCKIKMLSWCFHVTLQNGHGNTAHEQIILRDIFLLSLTLRWLMRLREEDGWMSCFRLIRYRIDDRSRGIRVGGNSSQGASRPGPHHLLPHRRHSCSVGRTLLRRAFKPLPVGRQRLSLRLHLCRWRVSITPFRLWSPHSSTCFCGSGFTAARKLLLVFGWLQVYK